MNRYKKRMVFCDYDITENRDEEFSRLEQRRYIGGSSRASTATTQTSTVQNQQVGASEGAIAAGAGATINLEQVSDDIALAAFGEIGDVTQDAIKMASDTSKFSLGESLGFAQEFTSNQISSSRDERKDTLEFLNRQTEIIAAQAGVVSPASVTDQQKLLIIGLGILAAAGTVIVMVNKAK